MRIVEVTDIHGIKHKVDLDKLDAKQFAKNGDKVSFTMMAMDTAGGLFICDGEQLKKGNDMTDYNFTDEQLREMQKRSDEAYTAMCKDLEAPWRGKSNAVAAETADQAHFAAAQALQDAWKGNSHG